MRRSEFVTVPSFSPQAAAGSSTCGVAETVSLVSMFSETTNSSSFFNASRTAPARGSDIAGLAGQRERPHAGPSDPSGGEMAVDDGVDLVGSLRRLVHALRETGDGLLVG